MSTSGRRRALAEPKVVLLAIGMVLVMLLFVIAIFDTDAIWLVVVTVLAIAAISLAIVFDLRRVIANTGDTPDTTVAPGRAVVMCTGAMTADQVLEAVDTTGAKSIMFVAPEGLGTGGLMVDEVDYDRAVRAETKTVAALRRAGVNAAGHVGDRNPEHAIVDALALFPAGNVVIVARRSELPHYRRHVDTDALKRRTGADVRILEVVEA
jgi:hypothetical protein